MKLLIQVLTGIIVWSGAAAQTTGTATVSFTLPVVAIMDMESASSKNISLVLSGPAEAGNVVALPAANSALWLNLTSAVAASQTRRVTAQILGSIPAGISVNLLVSGPSGSGGGGSARGTPVSSVALNNAAQTVISNIGGAYTGNGVNNGFQLNYSAALQNYSQLRSGSGTFTVVYTLIDN